MARWEPGAEDRLRRAALELYSAHGYDSVTVEQIAERAGLKRRSYFRYFPDKREVLFAGSERLPTALADAIQTSNSASLMSSLQSAMGEVGTRLIHELGDRAEEARLRRTIIARTPELREREQSKTADVAQAVANALIASSVPAPTATLIGSVAAAVFAAALDRCFDQPTSATFRTVLDDLIEEIAAFAESDRPSA